MPKVVTRPLGSIEVQSRVVALGLLWKMATEKDLEDVVASHPELIEDGLTLEARQAVVLGRRIDLLFRDRHGRRLLVELKWGVIKDEHVGQLLSYEGVLVNPDQPDIRVMLVATRVPPSFRRALDHHGISWKEIRPREIATLLMASGENELALRFEENDPSSDIIPRKKPAEPRERNQTFRAAFSASPINDSGTPALLAIVNRKSFDQAREEFKAGKEEIYFGANSKQVGPALGSPVPIKRVYFKVEKRPEIIAFAPFIAMTADNIPQKRLQGCEHDLYKYYYGFREISLMPSPIPLSALRRFRQGKPIRNDVPGACLIQDPSMDD